MSSTPDPRFGAILDVLNRFRSEPAPLAVGPYIDEILATIDSVHHFDEETRAQPQSADDAFLRSQAVDLAVRGGLGYGGAGDLARAAATILAFLRDGTAPADPNLGQAAKVDEPIGLPGRPAAPMALHEAIDRTWTSVVEGGEHLTVTAEDADEDVLEQLRTLTDSQIARTTFVAAIVRSLASTVRADRHAGEDA